MLMYLFNAFNKKNIQEKDEDTADYSLIKEIENAKNEWEYALRRFNDVSDPFVVDYIIYYIIAAERRYMYLLSKYKDIHKGKRLLPMKDIGQQINNDILNG